MEQGLSACICLHTNLIPRGDVYVSITKSKSGALNVRVHWPSLSPFVLYSCHSVSNPPPPCGSRQKRTMPHPDLSIPLLPDAEHDLPLPHPHHDHHHHRPQYTWPEAGPSSPRGTSAVGFLGNVDAEYAYTTRYPQSEIGDGRGRGQEQRKRVDRERGMGVEVGAETETGRDIDTERDADTERDTDLSKAGIFGAKAIAAMTGAMATSLLSTSRISVLHLYVWLELIED